jgi:hypothetical protein
MGNVLTNTWNTNNSISVRLHAEQNENLLNIVQTLLSSKVCRLSQKRAELQRLANSRSRQMDILLLDIASFPLERVVTGETVHENLASNDAHCYSGGQNVE